MEREALWTQVNDALESEGRTLTLSEETINGELDDALEGVTDDSQVDEAFVGKLTKRLKRMDGNLHKDVSNEVKAYKAAHPAPTPPTPPTPPKDGEKGGDDNTPEYIKKLDELTERLSRMEESRKQDAVRAANDAAMSDVTKALRSSFKKAGIDVNEYILRQTLRDVEIPAPEEGEHVDVDAIARKAERSYYKNLKEAGLDNKDTGKTRMGSRASSGECAADRFFASKGKKEGWGK